MKDTIKNIIVHLGGRDNITAVTNCMTRLRVTVADENAVDKDKLGGLDEVLGLVHDRQNKFEIVVGPGKCKKFADKIYSMGIGVPSGKTTEPVTTGGDKNKVRALLKTIGDIFVPMIPGIMTAGLCAGFASLLAQICPDYKDNTALNIIHTLLALIQTSFMTYMTAWAGYRAAERFGATPIIGGMLGMITSLDGINEIARTLGLYDTDKPLNSVLCAGKGGVLAVVFGVYMLSLIEKRLREKIPDNVDVIVTPFLSLLICAIPYIAIVMPVFGYVSSGIAWVFGQLCLSDNLAVRMITGYVSSALFLPLVAGGMHHGFVALYAVQLEELGYVTLYPALAMAGAGQVGAGIAIHRKARKVGNTHLRKVSASALPAGILGVGEPLIYGVTLPLGKPFIAAGLGAGFGGAFVMAMQVASTTWGPSGVLGAFVMTAGPNGAVVSVISYLAGLVISCIGGYIFTSLVIRESDLAPEKPADNTDKDVPEGTPENLPQTDYPAVKHGEHISL